MRSAKATWLLCLDAPPPSGASCGCDEGRGCARNVGGGLPVPRRCRGRGDRGRVRARPGPRARALRDGCPRVRGRGAAVRAGGGFRAACRLRRARAGRAVPAVRFGAHRPGARPVPAAVAYVSDRRLLRPGRAGRVRGVPDARAVRVPAVRAACGGSCRRGGRRGGGLGGHGVHRPAAAGAGSGGVVEVAVRAGAVHAVVAVVRHRRGTGGGVLRRPGGGGGFSMRSAIVDAGMHRDLELEEPSAQALRLE